MDDRYQQRRKCGRCGEWKHPDEFDARTDLPGSLKDRCRSCEEMRVSQLPVEKLSAPSGLAPSRQPRAHRLRANTYDALFRAQNGLCRACYRAEVALDEETGAVRRLTVYIRRATNEVLGLICSRCVIALNANGDSPDICMRQAQFLLGRAARRGGEIMRAEIPDGIPGGAPLLELGDE